MRRKYNLVRREGRIVLVDLKYLTNTKLYQKFKEIFPIFMINIITC